MCQRKYLIVLASGTGSRFGADCPKQFVRIRGKMILEYTLAACDCGLFDEMILVVSGEYVEEVKKLVAGKYRQPIRVVAGGATRRESCKCGVDAIPNGEAFVVIHNAAQPFVSTDTLKNCLSTLQTCDAVVSAIPCTYNILKVNRHDEVDSVLERDTLRVDMGVEGFRIDVLRRALTIADQSVANIVGFVSNHRLGVVKVFKGDVKNIKITYSDDMHLAKRRICNGEQ